ncbi:hypothetical protein VKS41_004536 [Umbelopsis sp. WA50703]
MKISIALATALVFASTAGAFKTKTPPLSTKWTEEAASAAVPWPSYPRPQLQRQDWVNLNGVWEFQNSTEGALTDMPFGKTLSDEIKVPYCMESGLSGIMKHYDYSVYKKTFTIPSDWKDQSVLVNFQAVDNEATVFVNGKKVGYNKGGYNRFQLDITDALKDGQNELMVHVFDPTDSNGNNPPLGKQRSQPSHIFYTPCSGIWQSVFIEPVPKQYITRLDVLTDMHGNMNVTAIASTEGSGENVVVEVLDMHNKTLISKSGQANKSFMVKVPNVKTWSPDQPNLYNYKVTLGNDVVSSYTGFRTISRGIVNGVERPLLNGEFIFQFGTLDQGFWPDGIHSPPTEEGMIYDIQFLKKLGFNMIRKHIKVEPDLYYAAADKLGILLWQDMPAMVEYKAPTDAQQAEFEKELATMIDNHKSFTSIVTWIIYNEGWGQLPSGPETYLTPRVKSQDPSRLVNSVTGWNDHGAGDFHDNHHYSIPQCGSPFYSIASTPYDKRRIGVQGEFGGIGQNTSAAHLWPIAEAVNTINQTYEIAENNEAYNYRTLQVLEQLREQVEQYSCSGAVYTQTTDVEGEVNGLLTYDRKVIRTDVPKWQKMIKDIYKAAKSRA